MNKIIKIFPYITVLISFFFMACSADKMDLNPNENYDLSQVLSIFVEDDVVGTSVIFLNSQGIRTEFKLNNQTVSLDKITQALPVGAHFETSINSNNYVSYVFRRGENDVDTYFFYKGISKNPYDQLFYIKNDKRVQLDTINHAQSFMLGEISMVDSKNGNEVFAGSLKKLVADTSPLGYTLIPGKPFIWEGEEIKVLPFPENDSQYRGINSIHLSEDLEHVYVSGMMRYPMYWKDGTPIILSNYIGEVTQVITNGNNVFAVGYINKYDSRDINNTACYWKNGNIVELEEQAVATCIYIDGDDIYVGGATGRTIDDYRACYWKNGMKYIIDQSRN